VPDQFKYVPLDRQDLVGRGGLALEPRSSDVAEQIGMGAARDQMGMND
jgi:hypothetical protein